MQQQRYERLQETLYFDRMPNGLHVYVLPKPGFQKTYATFSTKYGSIDNHFQLEGSDSVKVPDGIAHFLEHKMFEEPGGEDVFARFASHGASANAFTSFDRTAYLFSATEHIHSNIETLLDFVQRPHFTDENVEKEKGIIAQEINMYLDNPDYRAYYGLIESLYSEHPVHIDIAGTVQSIYQITKEMLYDCYHTFYHPTNMQLFIVGGVVPEEIFELVRNNQAKKSYATQGTIKRIVPDEPNEIKESRNVLQLAVSLPKCIFGFKDTVASDDPQEQLRKELEMKLLLDILFGSSSAIRQKLYDENLITDSFGAEYNCHPQYAFTAIGGETRDPDELLRRVQEEVERISQAGISEEEFERSRRKRIGNYLRMLNSPEAIANEFTKYKFRNQDLFDILPLYESITLEQVMQRLHKHFDWNKMAASIVRRG